MNKKRLSIAIGSMLATAIAFAGTTTSLSVSVTNNADLTGSAAGLMSTARRSLNSQELIGCSIQRYIYNFSPDTVSAYGWCQARTASGTSAFCSTDKAEMLDAIQGISTYSYINFAWKADGTCNKIVITNQSAYIP